MDAREDRDPMIRRARALKNAQNYPEAVALYNKALDRRPGMARAHLELANVYDQFLDDDVRAIYHYQRYLELRPTTEKREYVEELIRVAKLSFAASIPDRPSEAVREIAMLKQEVDALRGLLAEKQSAAGPADESVATPSKRKKAEARPDEKTAAAEPEPAPAGPMDSYVVQPGDTLSRVAGKVYGDPRKWEQIFNANRDALPSPESVRVGQTLQIPRG
jgi:nucleoid-associated protein YgaU